MKNLKMGQFTNGDSIIHRFDPRTKIIGCLLIITSIIISSNYMVIFINFGILISAVLMSKIKVLKFFRRLKPLFLLLLFTFIFQSILTRGDKLFSIGNISITSQGISLGVITVFRLLEIYICSTLLTLSTSPMKLTGGLESLLSPLKIINFPVSQLSMIISISLRFIPTIIEEADNIKCAQKSRGSQFESLNLFVRLKSISSILIPVLANSLQRAEELAVAMESRCYNVQSTINNISELHYKREDKLAIGIVVFNFIFCLYLWRVLPLLLK